MIVSFLKVFTNSTVLISYPMHFAKTSASPIIAKMLPNQFYLNVINNTGADDLLCTNGMGRLGDGRQGGAPGLLWFGSLIQISIKQGITIMVLYVVQTLFEEII